MHADDEDIVFPGPAAAAAAAAEQQDAPAAAVAGNFERENAAAHEALAEQAMAGGDAAGMLAQLMARQEAQLRWQMAEAAKMDARAAKQAAENEAEAARRWQCQLEAAAQGLKDQRVKEAAQFMWAVAGLDDSGERTALARAYANMQLVLANDPDDLEEANDLIQVAVKRLKNLSAEQQEELGDKLRVKKLKR